MAKLPHETSRAEHAVRRSKKPGVIDLEAKAVEIKASSKVSRVSDKEGNSDQTELSKESIVTKRPEVASGSKGRAEASGTSAGSKADRKSSDRSSRSATVEPNHNNSGFIKGVLAGIAGGLITLAGLLVMQYVGFSFSPIVMGEKRVSVSRISSLQSELDRLKNSFTSAQDLALTRDQFSLLENGIKEMAGSSVSFQTATRARLQALTSGLASLKASTGSLTALFEGSEDSSLIANFRQMSSRVVSLEHDFAALAVGVNGVVDKRVNRLEERLKRIVAGEKLSRFVALSSLKTSIDRGEGFSDILSSLEILMGPSRKLDLLKPYAATGIPTARTLLEEFRALRRDMVLALTSGPDAGIGERLLSSVRSLVTVSSSEALPGNSPKAIFSRIEAGLKVGKSGLALSEWETLPDAARKVSGLWADRLMRRIKIERDISTLMQTIQSNNQGDGRSP